MSELQTFLAEQAQHHATTAKKLEEMQEKMVPITGVTNPNFNTDAHEGRILLFGK